MTTPIRGAMLKSELARTCSLSMKQLQADLQRWDKEILVLDPIYKLRKLFIPKVVFFLSEKYHGDINYCHECLEKLLTYDKKSKREV